MVERAVLAGGCFWGMQDLIRKQPGVVSTRVGYSGGDVPNATYRNHGTHAESIEVIFDPEVMSFRDLLEFFFQMHDPTTENRQGNDIGPGYRSAIYYADEAQKQVALDTIADVDCIRHLAGTRRDRGRAGGRFLGGRARAPGLPGAGPQRLYLPFPAPRLGPAQTRRGRVRHGRPGKRFRAFSASATAGGCRRPGPPPGRFRSKRFRPDWFRDGRFRSGAA